jgi:endo-1,4-beta-D-glucanase Y
VLDVGNDDVRSEGMSYGMMISVQMGRKAQFDALWNWAWTHMRYRAGPRQSYFRWQCKPEGCAGFGKDAVPASDGEAYMATALLMAAARWGHGKGVYDYDAQAQELLTAMLHKETMNGGIQEGARSMFSPRHGQVVFVPVGDAAEFSDPSYHLPAFYELWAPRPRTASAGARSPTSAAPTSRKPPTRAPASRPTTRISTAAPRCWRATRTSATTPSAPR